MSSLLTLAEVPRCGAPRFACFAEAAATLHAPSAGAAASSRSGASGAAPLIRRKAALRALDFAHQVHAARACAAPFDAEGAAAVGHELAHELSAALARDRGADDAARLRPALLAWSLLLRGAGTPRSTTTAAAELADGLVRNAETVLSQARALVRRGTSPESVLSETSARSLRDMCLAATSAVVAASGDGRKMGGAEDEEDDENMSLAARLLAAAADLHRASRGRLDDDDDEGDEEGDEEEAEELLLLADEDDKDDDGDGEIGSSSSSSSSSSSCSCPPSELVFDCVSPTALLVAAQVPLDRGATALSILATGDLRRVARRAMLRGAVSVTEAAATALALASMGLDWRAGGGGGGGAAAASSASSAPTSTAPPPHVVDDALHVISAAARFAKSHGGVGPSSTLRWQDLTADATSALRASLSSLPPPAPASASASAADDAQGHSAVPAWAAAAVSLTRSLLLRARTPTGLRATTAMAVLDAAGDSLDAATAAGGWGPGPGGGVAVYDDADAVPLLAASSATSSSSPLGPVVVVVRSEAVRGVASLVATFPVRNPDLAEAILGFYTAHGGLRVASAAALEVLSWTDKSKEDDEEDEEEGEDVDGAAAAGVDQLPRALAGSVSTAAAELPETHAGTLLASLTEARREACRRIAAETIAAAAERLSDDALEVHEREAGTEEGDGEGDGGKATEGSSPSVPPPSSNTVSTGAALLAARGLISAMPGLLGRYGDATAAGKGRRRPGSSSAKASAKKRARVVDVEGSAATLTKDVATPERTVGEALVAALGSLLGLVAVTLRAAAAPAALATGVEDGLPSLYARHLADDIAVVASLGSSLSLVLPARSGEGKEAHARRTAVLLARVAALRGEVVFPRETPAAGGAASTPSSTRSLSRRHTAWAFLGGMLEQHAPARGSAAAKAAASVVESSAAKEVERLRAALTMGGPGREGDAEGDDEAISSPGVPRQRCLRLQYAFPDYVGGLGGGGGGGARGGGGAGAGAAAPPPLAAALRSRNRVVDSWLQEKVHKGEGRGRDRFADLEDFIVE
jgi:hypothetical protein